MAVYRCAHAASPAKTRNMPAKSALGYGIRLPKLLLPRRKSRRRTTPEEHVKSLERQLAAAREALPVAGHSWPPPPPAACFSRQRCTPSRTQTTHGLAQRLADLASAIARRRAPGIAFAAPPELTRYEDGGAKLAPSSHTQRVLRRTPQPRPRRSHRKPQ
jgi:hypothetical protein